MEYYKLLQLDREPFSNSPDPDYFFQSSQHLSCLQKLELALRLKRGLNVVIGDVGTGKTTLCRHLIRIFNDEPDFESHLILDPSFDTSENFLKVIFELICERPYNDDHPEAHIKESIKQQLFDKGVERDKTVVLIIDEGQKISDPCVEILRELLNYETNTFKLLQIVIFAQLEFESILDNHANFADRINLLHHLAPMNFSDTRQMVQHRLKLSSAAAKPRNLFTLPAMWAIYLNSRGYPRKIIHLCHQSMLAMIIQNRTRAGWALIRSCKNRIRPSSNPRRRFIWAGIVATSLALILVGFTPEFISRKMEGDPGSSFKIETSPNQIPSAVSAPPQVEPSALKTPAPEPIQAHVVAQTPAPEPGQAPGLDQNKSATSKGDGFAPDPAEPQKDTYNTPSPVVTPAPPQAVAPAPGPPELLGQLIVKPGDTMFGLVHQVYGTRRNKYLRKVIRVNPHIQDPNAIDIGHVIHFPSLRFETKTGDYERHWIVLDEGPSLPGTIQRLDEIYKESHIPAQMIPNWSSQSGLRFHIAVKGYFTKKEEAYNYLKTLPAEMASRAKVVTGWPEDAILYCDPYGGGIR